MLERLRVFSSLIIAATLLSGCGGDKGSGESASPAASSSGSSGAPAAAGIQPCKLLTDEQVATVLPNHSGGMVAHSGASLIEGVNAYQCSYTNAATDLLTVILNVAVDDARFDKIKPSDSLVRDYKEVGIGDGGWLHGDQNNAKVTAVKGRTVIDLDLMASGASGKSEALIELARTIAKQIQ